MNLLNCRYAITGGSRDRAVQFECVNRSLSVINPRAGNNGSALIADELDEHAGTPDDVKTAATVRVVKLGVRDGGCDHSCRQTLEV